MRKYGLDDGSAQEGKAGNKISLKALILHYIVPILVGATWVLAFALLFLRASGLVGI